MHHGDHNIHSDYKKSSKRKDVMVSHVIDKEDSLVSPVIKMSNDLTVLILLFNMFEC